MCDRHLADGPLTCNRTTPHEPGHGCTYATSPGDPEPGYDE